MSTASEPSLSDYFASLDPALIEFVMHDNDGPIKRHMAMYPDAHSRAMSADSAVFKCALFKAATGRRALPMEVRSKAKRYLIEHGWQSWDDGDVPV
jgi:hypothetical protein